MMLTEDYEIRYLSRLLFELYPQTTNENNALKEMTIITNGRYLIFLGVTSPLKFAYNAQLLIK